MLLDQPFSSSPSISAGYQRSFLARDKGSPCSTLSTRSAVSGVSSWLTRGRSWTHARRLVDCAPSAAGPRIARQDRSPLLVFEAAWVDVAFVFARPCQDDCRAKERRILPQRRRRRPGTHR